MLLWSAILAVLTIFVVAAATADSNTTLAEFGIRTKRCAKPHPIVKKKTKKSGTIDENKMRKKLLECTNKYRRAHQAPPLKESKKLNKIAHKWAEKLAKQTNLRHQKTKGRFGENLYSYYHSAGKLNKAEAACDAWYGELPLYDFKTGKVGKAGHFTQLVWKSSRRVGTGVVAKNGRYVVVSDYEPAGNVLTKFKENVLPKKKSRRSFSQIL